jgi:iron complex outermembrane receptor protein
VLAPASGVRDPETSKVSVLERVIVTGNAVGTPRRSLSVGVEVIDGEQLRREGYSSLAAALDASVPGLWVWDQSPGSVVMQYGGVRGASSFSTSYPKMYIDGVEVANPLLVTQLDPDVVDRIEVIRGPQGSALYGSDAISGVINVITRHDGAPASGARVQLSSVAGASASAFGSSLVPTHDQRVSMRAGTNLRSAGLAIEFGQTGAVVPSSQSRQLTIVGDGRAVTSGATLSGSARLFDKRAAMGRNPLLGALSSTPLSSTSPGTGAMAGTVVTPTTSSDAKQRVQLYTLGGSATLAPRGIWTNTFVAGVDGYRLKDVGDVTSPVPSALDATLLGSRGGGDRATFRASSVAQFGDGATGPPTTLTLSLEHSVLRQSGTITNVSTPLPGQRYSVATDALAETWNHNTGALVQASSSWRDAVFLTGGLRLERNDAFSGSDRYPLLPLLGVAVVHSFGGAELKLRSSFGKGIRPPQSSVRGSWSNQGMPGARAGLDPEVQTGIESGAELYFGQAFSLQATRFDQRATGLIQNVATAIDTQIRGGVVERRMRFQLENVGEISNRGWELQTAAHRGALGVTGTFTSVDSRVRTVAKGYYGDLRAGDRMLAVPARTASLNASWSAAHWSTSLTATRADDWINYDRIALASAYVGADGAPGRDITGWRLREFWRSYTGETHLRLNTSRDVGRGLTLLLTGDNLLGGQLGEPDNVTIRQGRMVTGGLRASF